MKERERERTRLRARDREGGGREQEGRGEGEERGERTKRRKGREQSRERDGEKQISGFLATSNERMSKARSHFLMLSCVLVKGCAVIQPTATWTSRCNRRGL